jgi:hypothetical protein
MALQTWKERTRSVVLYKLQVVLALVAKKIYLSRTLWHILTWKNLHIDCRIQPKWSDETSIQRNINVVACLGSTCGGYCFLHSPNRLCALFTWTTHLVIDVIYANVVSSCLSQSQKHFKYFLRWVDDTAESDMTLKQLKVVNASGTLERVDVALGRTR